MEYQALYRKYRPQRFADVVGQDHVTDTLAREVVESKVAHAYLFAGPRGTGKTTTARVLAKALNCPDRQADGEPCNRCASCAAITDGSSLDVIELDAASHNKVEDIREIRVNVGTVASAEGGRRVYILDEAHMLSRAAANALLKTLEEPPEHVHFVLATTEPYKLPDTVRSRSQRFDFHPIPAETLAAYLDQIAASEDFTTGPDGLTAVAQHADGSVRDALSLMEQVAALGAGRIEAAGVVRALGLVGADAYRRYAAAVSASDTRAGLELIADVAGQGADLRRFVAETLAYFRGVFLAQYAPNLEEIVDEPSDRIDEWRRLAREIESGDVLRVIDQLSEALVQLREGREERLVVELATIRLTRPETASDPASLAARIERLEARLRRAEQSPPAAAPEAAVPPSPPVARAAPVPSAAVSAPPPEVPGRTRAPEAPAADAPAVEGKPGMAPSPPPDLTIEQVETIWPALVAQVRDAAGPRRYAYLREASPGAVEDATVVLELPGHLGFHLDSLQSDDGLKHIVERVASELLGGGVSVRYETAQGGDRAAHEHEAPEPVRAPDKELMAESGSGAVSPEDLVIDLLGGEVVSDE